MISDKEYVNEALQSRERPIMDLTNKTLGLSPFSRFKSTYLKYEPKNDELLKAKIDSLMKDDNIEEAIPIQYILTNRGRPSSAIKPVYSSDVRDLENRSGKVSGDYVSQAIATSGTLTGIAGLDAVRDYIARSAARTGFPAGTSNINMTNYAPWRGFKNMADPYTLYKGQREKGFHGKLGYNFNIRGKQIQGNLYDSFIRHFGSDIGDSLSSGSSNKGRFINRIIGYGASMPRSGLYASPLLFKSVTKTLKGSDTESKRYKTFDWIEKHPVETMAVAVAPSLIHAGIREGMTFRDMLKGGVKGLSMHQPALGLLRHALSLSVPLGYAALKGRYDTNNEENRLSYENFRKEV